MERVASSVTRVTLADVALARAWNVRGDATRTAFVSEVPRALRLALPMQPNTSTRDAAATLLWLGPTSWLLVDSRDAGPGALDAARKALNAAGGALFDVSASYVAWRLSGAAAARVLNRGCPLDLHPTAFPAGHCAQSVLGHIGVLLYRPGEEAAFVVIVARSFAADALEFLRTAAATEG
jgi:sarcosine oxidase subunit gamma